MEKKAAVKGSDKVVKKRNYKDWLVQGDKRKGIK
jgi:hypothetical protein